MKNSILLLIACASVIACKKNSIEPNNEPDAEVAITSIQPDYGRAFDEIVVTGTGFSTITTENTVALNGISAEVVSATVSQLVIKAPGNASHGNIEVKVKSKSAISADKFYYTPEIDGLDSESGKIGDAVAVTGKHFIADPSTMEVTFNGTAATISVATATTLTVTVPEGASTGSITVALKGREPVTGPIFTIVGEEETTDLFTVVSGNITPTKILGSGEVFIVDDIRNTLYALSADQKQLLKVDLASLSQTVLLDGVSPFLLGNSAAPFYPSSMALSDDGRSLYLLCTTNNNVATQTNVFKVGTTNGEVTPIGNRKIGLAGLGGLTGGGARLPLFVDNEENIYTRHNEGGITNFQALAKFNSDLSSFIHVIDNKFSGSNSLIRINETTFRALYDYAFTGSQYVDITEGVAGTPQRQPVAIVANYLLARAGMEKFAMLKSPMANSYNLFEVNADWSANTQKGQVTIAKQATVNGRTFDYFIDLMCADSDGNLYVRVNVNIAGNSGIGEYSGIYKLKVD
ncbi:IPT/TIG domain-containing protein [Parapedobacter sp. 2B3]|uniref:IPT/TIG domain-containing protein n=1 Tax=Parapedobacter sp. 2B3 TaxID=3342381 RepID=UPI0035B607F2